jgi:aminoglycoside phosphotransferase (APT) family kinase protein
VPSDARTLVATLWSGLRGFAVPTFVADAVAQALAVTPPGDRAFVLSHNDVNPSNLVYDGEKIMLVDWDTAGVNDPFFDLAAASLFLRMDADSCARLIALHDDAPVAALPSGFIYNRRILGALFCVMSMSFARESGHHGFAEPASLDAAPSLADFYQRMQSGAVSLTTTEGRWEFAVALLKESILL